MEEAKQYVKRNARNTFPTRNNSKNDSSLTNNPNQITGTLGTIGVEQIRILEEERTR